MELPFIDLYMIHPQLDKVNQIELPDGFKYVYYQEGYEEDWINIQLDAKQINSYEEGVEIFNRTFSIYRNELKKRMIFIEYHNELIATATAYFIEIDNKQTAKLHWVAIKEAYQGYKLSKPLLTYCLRVMKDLGYQECILHTQTTTWIAVKIYLDLGFKPYQKEKRIEGWKLMKELLKHPTLEEEI